MPLSGTIKTLSKKRHSEKKNIFWCNPGLQAFSENGEYATISYLG